MITDKIREALAEVTIDDGAEGNEATLVRILLRERELLIGVSELLEKQRDYWIHVQSLGKTKALHEGRLTKDNQAITALIERSK